MKPLVSVIIACHNCQRYLQKCLQSIVNQTYENIEIIICDDASTDRSMEIIQSFQRKDNRFIVLCNTESLKAGATRNRCIEQSSGEYIVIQDADDYSEINRIERLVKVLDENDQVDFVSSSAYMFSYDAGNYDDILKVKHKEPNRWNFLWSISFVHAATMFRAKCIKAVSGYRVAKETIRGQDYDLFMRLYAAGYKGINIDEPLYWVRADNSFLERRIKSSPYNEYRVRKSGFKQLKMMPIGYVFALKPFFAEMYHLIVGISRRKK